MDFRSEINMILSLLRLFQSHRETWITTPILKREFNIADDNATRFRTRALMKQVQSVAAERGDIIISGGKGYKLTTNHDEIKAYKQRIRRKAYSTLQKVGYVLKAQRYNEQRNLL